MRYRKLDENGDMVFGHQQIDFFRDSPEAVAQAVLTRLRLWLGEWFVDQTAGTPYQQAMLGTNKQESIEPEYRARILGTQGVKSIVGDLELLFDSNERKVTINVEIDTIYGPAELNGIL